jgi:hypothetical protein
MRGIAPQRPLRLNPDRRLVERAAVALSTQAAVVRSSCRWRGAARVRELLCSPIVLPALKPGRAKKGAFAPLS